MAYDDRECALDHIITVSDAPIRCGYCDEKIVGSGKGRLRALVERVCEHTCPTERDS